MKCEFPHCNFTAHSRHQIHKHHITPKEKGGTDDQWNLIWLCPTHHNLIYSEESGHGIHTMEVMNMIRIIRWVSTTWGRVLEYEELKNKGMILYFPPPPDK